MLRAWSANSMHYHMFRRSPVGELIGLPARLTRDARLPRLAFGCQRSAGGFSDLWKSPRMAYEAITSFKFEISSEPDSIFCWSLEFPLAGKHQSLVSQWARSARLSPRSHYGQQQLSG